MDREAWCAAIHGVMKNWPRLSDWTELNWSAAIRGNENRQQVPLLAHSQRGASLFLLREEDRGEFRDWAEGQLRCVAHPLVWCWAEGMLSTCFCSIFLQAPQKWQLGFLVSLYLWVQNLPHLYLHTVIFSPLQLLCILFLKEIHVKVQSGQPCSKGSQVPGLSKS